jgi:tRNA1Val (adenine37-N6)-methyltransferase
MIKENSSKVNENNESPNTQSSKPFQFKQFHINQDRCAMKVGTDGVLLGAWVDTSEATKILDIGAGTGVIAIMLAQRTETANIDAVEIDEIASVQAQENIDGSPFASRINLENVSIQDYAKNANQKYDLIVSNPPFFSGGTFSSNQDKNNVRHTVKLPHGDLLLATHKLLNPKGKFCVILPFIEGLRFIDIAKSYHFYCTRLTEVLPKADKGVERLLIELKLEEQPTLQNQLIIQHQKRNDFTAEYQQLTKDFYTIL